MTEDFELTRRKTLAALGTIGVTSAGAGLGTSAYFSDQETFENNRLTAGTLDMKVAATEQYSDWSPDEAEYAGMAADEASTDIRLPAGDGQSDAQDIAIDVDGDSYADFFDALSTDENGDPYNRVNGGVDAAADGGLCGTGSDADGPMIIDISDVKPGDFGGAQFAFELCDNPGYVWLTGGLDSANENGTTEPEADDPDEESGVVELLDAIQVTYSVGPINGDPSGFADTDAGFQPVEQYTLREFLATLDGDGIALDGDIDAEIGGGTGDQGCFAGGNPDEPTVHQVSVVWWLPIDHGNQVQSDSATFELGFYTEQCRHNDGETDLVAYYPFENSADDVSGNGYDGTLENGVSFTSGQVGRAAEFDGEDDYVDAGTSLSSAFSELTVTAWINTLESGTQAIVERNYWNADGGFGLFVQNGMIRWGHYPDRTKSTTEISDGEWHHVVGTVAPAETGGESSYRVYIDGEFEDELVTRGITASNGPLGIGRRIANFAGDYYFNGAIDDVRIYARALSASEVQSLYDSA